jgi:hypothetical protein
MYLLDQYRGTTLSCRYAIPSHLASADSRTQLEEAVKVAVVDIIMRHPMLQVGTMDATSKTPSWIQLQSLDLTRHIQWVHLEENDDFDQTVYETFCTQIDGRFYDLPMKEPGWKMTLIRQGNAPVMEVLLTWNHPQFDGAGAKVIHEDFLEMLNAESGEYKRTGLDGDILQLPQEPPMLPIPIERLLSLPVDLKYLAKVVWEDIRPQFLNRDISQAPWCPIRPSPYKTQFRAFFIDQTSLLAILALCRQNKTTITGLLNGLVLVALASNLDDTTAPVFQSSTIVDHRRNLPPAPSDAPWGRSDRAVSNYVTQAPHRYDPKVVARVRSKLSTDAVEKRDLSTDLQQELWAVSAQNRRDIEERLETGLRNDLVGVFKFVSDWQQTMKGAAKRKRQFAWLMTNIGVLDGTTAKKPGRTMTTGSQTDENIKPEDVENWSINRAQFGLSTEVPSAAFEFAPVSVAGHGMCVSVSWPDCSVDTVLGERIMADLERWLGQLASQS